MPWNGSHEEASSHDVDGAASHEVSRRAPLLHLVVRHLQHGAGEVGWRGREGEGSSQLCCYGDDLFLLHRMNFNLEKVVKLKCVYILPQFDIIMYMCYMIIATRQRGCRKY